MPQIFHRSFNTISKVTIFGAVFILAGLCWFAAIFYRSSYVTETHVSWEQPVPFSHAHHVGHLGIDCRYCHTSVETSSFAGIPPTKTCMNCHQQIWTGSSMLAAVRDSYRSNESIPWERVHNLPGFVYFNHSIHVAKGVGCASCHGRIDQMPLTYQENTLLMEWCLECHRNPENNLRPKSEIFNMSWRAEDQASLGRQLKKDYNVRSPHELTSCSTCHR